MVLLAVVFQVAVVAGVPGAKLCACERCGCMGGGNAV